jgi:hypothetical protein
MPFSLLWLPTVLEEAGLKVSEVPGWRDRGRREMGPVLGVMCHHTADRRSGIMPSLDTLLRGRPEDGIPGPLAQLGLGRDGTYFVVAAGLSNHAGKGDWLGITTGNTNFIGIEAENRGDGQDRWPPVQVDAYHRGVAAILKHVGRGVEFCVGHKEWARNRRPPDAKKHDPTLDMAEFRTVVSAILGGAPTPPPIPPVEPTGPRRRTLRRGDDDPLVVRVQTKLGITPTSTHFGPRTEAAVREFQRRSDMVPDGIVGPETWQALDAAP